jgi:hypothetical protein
MLTALLNTLSATSALPTAQNLGERRFQDEQPQNVLSHIPETGRLPLMTLHVIFPTLVLPALDLLDRKLVTRLEVTGNITAPQEPEVAAPINTEGRGVTPDGTSRAEGHVCESSGFHEDDQASNTTSHRHDRLYLVRSGQNVVNRRRWHSEAEEGDGNEQERPADATQYLVHLDAWNCSCAVFALSAFPLLVADASSIGHLKSEDEEDTKGLEGSELSDESEGREESEVIDEIEESEGSEVDSEHEESEQSEERAQSQEAELDGDRMEEDDAGRVSEEEGEEDSWPGESSSVELDEEDSEEIEETADFGGLCRDGELGAKENGEDAAPASTGVPCCKHLLACLLADRWERVLGQYITQQQVDKAELVGIFAGI